VANIWCQIRIKGHLSSQWSDWFDGLTVINEENGEAVLVGELPDEAALYGVLQKAGDLGLPLIELRRKPAEVNEETKPR
jgi:hypothetical protein